MSFLEVLWIIVQIMVGYNLLLPFVLYLFWRIRSRRTTQEQAEGSEDADYAIVVTAYEHTDTLGQVVDSILKLDYSNYLVYVVADNCDISGLNFNSDKVVVLRPEQVLASNTKSHFYAIRNFRREHDRITIIDSDNLVERRYLHHLNVYFDRGFHAVQGLRKAKNLNTSLSRLDAARDIYYHFFDGRVLFDLGSSATLSGSGMAFSVWLYRLCLEHLEIKGAGFDKVLQYQILSRNYRIAFAQNAFVYDEKTSRADQLVNQRSRWINTWFKYFGFGFSLLSKGLKAFSFNQILFGIILLRPPLFLFILASLICMLVSVFVTPAFALLWLLAFVLFVAGFFIAFRHSETDKAIYRSFVNIPRFIILQLVSLTKSRNANKRSVSTKHYHNDSINDISDSRNEN